jgi:hypothetical protein
MNIGSKVKVINCSDPWMRSVWKEGTIEAIKGTTIEILFDKKRYFRLTKGESITNEILSLEFRCEGIMEYELAGGVRHFLKIQVLK